MVSGCVGVTRRLSVLTEDRELFPGPDWNRPQAQPAITAELRGRVDVCPALAEIQDWLRLTVRFPRHGAEGKAGGRAGQRPGNSTCGGGAEPRGTPVGGVGGAKGAKRLHVGGLGCVFMNLS